jgi:hypothetical protein
MEAAAVPTSRPTPPISAVARIESSLDKIEHSLAIAAAVAELAARNWKFDA